jgi:hypothetical protein
MCRLTARRAPPKNSDLTIDYGLSFRQTQHDYFGLSQLPDLRKAHPTRLPATKPKCVACRRGRPGPISVSVRVTNTSIYSSAIFRAAPGCGMPQPSLPRSMNCIR